MLTTPPPSTKQTGVMLLEALIAIFIFSLGILAIVGMQAMAAKQITDARYRSDASLLANQLFGAMWSTDRTVATLQADFTGGSSGVTDGAKYTKWKNRVEASLPVPPGNPPTVDIAPDGSATVTIRWRAPSEGAVVDPHKYTVVAQIR